MEALYTELFETIEEKGIRTKDAVLKLRRELCRKYHPTVFPSTINILMHANQEQFNKLKFLVSKPMRTKSGVTPIALMTKPGRCPHGTCTMCPGGKGSIFGDTPQSYTGTEPSTLRAIRNNYDPYLIVFNRLQQFTLLNQSIEKVEVIIQGGTFPATTPVYQEEFLTYTYKALNDFTEVFYKNGELNLKTFKAFFELPIDYFEEARMKRIQEKILQYKGESTLKKEQERNETAQVRCIGLTIETKPDWALLTHGNKMLEQGCTRVELGLQSMDDKVLTRINRGHSMADNRKSMQILKDLGFKINAHIMVGLPEQDNKEIYQFFDDPDFRPDMLKIYPCMVMPGTKLEEEFKQGLFTALPTDEAIPIIAKFKTKVPKYCRIMRVQRDIPTKQTTAGVDRTNLRQMIFDYMKKNNMHCGCIRCNQITTELSNPELTVLEYASSGGKEFFIAIQQGKQIIGFCRLRFPSAFLREEITTTSAIIRQLHVYGQAIDLEKSGDVQHKGFGKELMQKAEQICREQGKDKLLVIAGIGVRGYYKKLGYRQDGPYVSKEL